MCEQSSAKGQAMRKRSTHRKAGGALVAFAALSFFVATVAPSAAQSASVSDLFGSRVTAVAGIKSPLLRGDYEGDGTADAVYFVQIAPSAPGKVVANDVHVVSLYDSEQLSAKSTGHGLAIVLKDGAEKFLAVDFAEGAAGFFDSPSWADVAGWGASPPLHSAKRNSADLKTYPCLGKGIKGDVILLTDEAGIDEALAWTGKTFKICVDPNNSP